jgi:hypothetical protein
MLEKFKVALYAIMVALVLLVGVVGVAQGFFGSNSSSSNTNQNSSQSTDTNNNTNINTNINTNNNTDNSMQMNSNVNSNTQTVAAQDNMGVCEPVERIRNMKDTARHSDYKVWKERCQVSGSNGQCGNTTEWPAGDGGRCETTTADVDSSQNTSNTNTTDNFSIQNINSSTDTYNVDNSRLHNEMGNGGLSPLCTINPKHLTPRAKSERNKRC